MAFATGLPEDIFPPGQQISCFHVPCPCSAQGRDELLYILIVAILTANSLLNASALAPHSEPPKL